MTTRTISPREALTKIQEIAKALDEKVYDCESQEMERGLNTILTVCEACLAPPDLPPVPTKECAGCGKTFQYSPQLLDHVCPSCGENVCPSCPDHCPPTATDADLQA